MKQLWYISFLSALSLNGAHLNNEDYEIATRKILARAYAVSEGPKSQVVEHQFMLTAQELAQQIQSCIYERTNTEKADATCKKAKERLATYVNYIFSDRVNLPDQDKIALFMWDPNVTASSLNQHDVDVASIKVIARSFIENVSKEKQDIEAALSHEAEILTAHIKNCIYDRTNPEQADEECYLAQIALHTYLLADKYYNSKDKSEPAMLKGLIWDRILAVAN